MKTTRDVARWLENVASSDLQADVFIIRVDVRQPTSEALDELRPDGILLRSNCSPGNGRFARRFNPARHV